MIKKIYAAEELMQMNVNNLIVDLYQKHNTPLWKSFLRLSC